MSAEKRLLEAGIAGGLVIAAMFPRMDMMVDGTVHDNQKDMHSERKKENKWLELSPVYMVKLLRCFPI